MAVLVAIGKGQGRFTVGQSVSLCTNLFQSTSVFQACAHLRGVETGQDLDRTTASLDTQSNGPPRRDPERDDASHFVQQSHPGRPIGVSSD